MQTCALLLRFPLEPALMHAHLGRNDVRNGDLQFRTAKKGKML